MHRLFLVLCALAAVAPLIRSTVRPNTVSANSDAFPGWTAPGSPVDPAWHPQPITEREQRFLRDFPGRLALFADDHGRTYLVRWVSRPTRKLHPLADCLRAIGYTTSPQPLQARPDGSLWSSFTARRETETLTVHERILDATTAAAWTDVSAWFWSATLARSPGPWWTIAEIHP